MDRRKALLVVAAVIAALGTLLVFLYVRGADTRADERYGAVQVLRAVKQIAPGESVEAAQAAGKIETGSVSQQDLLPDALTGIEPVAGRVAVTAIYPGEQLIGAKFGATGSATALTIPKGKIAISVNLTDTGRVSGFVSPGAEVAVFLNGEGAGRTEGEDGARLLLPRVQVIAVGATSIIPTTTTDAEGEQTTEELPRTLFTLAVDQKDAERVMYAATHGELVFALLTEESKVKPGPGIGPQNLFR